jgi:hypothetical protein
MDKFANMASSNYRNIISTSKKFIHSVMGTMDNIKGLKRLLKIQIHLQQS